MNVLENLNEQIDIYESVTGRKAETISLGDNVLAYAQERNMILMIDEDDYLIVPGYGKLKINNRPLTQRVKV